MPSSIRTLPPYQSTDWYGWAGDVDAAARAAATAAEAALKPLARTTFASRPNGAWTVNDSGQVVSNTGASPMTVASGVLTHSNTGSGSAGYAETNLGQRVGRVGATFQIPDNTKSGTMTFVIPLASWVSGTVGSNAACHFYVTATSWAYQIADGGSLTTLATGSLALASNTDYDLDIVLEGASARVVLPDSRVVSFTDSRINSYAGNFAIVEGFESSATTVPLKISAVRVDGVNAGPLNAGLAARMAAAAGYPAVFSGTPTDYDTTVSGTVEVGGAGARVPVIVPASGKLLVRLSSVLELQAADNVYAYPQLTYDAGGNLAGGNVSACRTICFQRFVLEALITGATPGASGFVTWFTAKTGSSTAIWHSGGLNGVGNTSAIPVR